MTAPWRRVNSTFEKFDEIVEYLFDNRKLFTEIDAAGCTVEGSELKIDVPPDATPYT
jgi:hypothetical protein